MSEPVKYGLEVEAEKVVSRLIPTIAILEELRKRDPKTFKIALEAVIKAYPEDETL